MRRRLRPFRIGLWLGIFAAVGFGVSRLMRARKPADSLDAMPKDFTLVEPPSPVVPVAAPVVPIVEPAIVEIGEVELPGEPPLEGSAPTWVDPEGRICPTSHPVKAKLSSKIFHLPGMLAYDRTNPDRCYADAASAEADGLRASKR